MEDIRENEVSPWPMEPYGEAGFTLGQFNSTFTSGRPQPPWPWLDGSIQIHGYVERFVKSAEAIQETIRHWQMNHHLSRTLANSLQKMHSDRE